jgi:hypothetical protein
MRKQRHWKICVSMLGLFAMAMSACAASGQKESAETTVPTHEPATVGVTVPPEKFEEIDSFFRSKTGTLQFDCYNHEVERTGKKYQGYVSLLIVVVPGGKASEVKVTSSTIGSPEIEACIVESARKWEWPDVPGRAPYNGSVAFKPAW